jgi:hypothetical protein
MKNAFEALLPAQADNTIRGMRLPMYVFTLIAIVSLVRSCIHLLAPDGGAGSIAGMNLAVDGAGGIIFCVCAVGQSATDVCSDPIGGGFSIQVTGSVHVCAADGRDPAAPTGGAYETGDVCTHTAGRHRQLRYSAVSRADAGAFLVETLRPARAKVADRIEK